MELAKSLDFYEKQIKSGVRAGLLGAIHIGIALKRIKDDNLWVTSGSRNFEKYVSSSHGFSKSTTYNMISVAEKFGKHILEDPSLQSIEPTRLIRLLPFVDDSNPLDLLHQAAQIPDAQGFDNQLRNLGGKTGTDDPHEHAWESINIEQCSICKLRRKVKDVI